MATTIEQKVKDAKAEIPPISPKDVMAMGDKVTILDVREPPEVAKGKAKGAVAVPRGVLEWQADPAAETHNKALDPKKTVAIYCGSGGRAALAGQALRELGYEDVRNMGGFKDWVEAGGETEVPS